MAKKKFSMSGVATPEFELIRKDMKPATIKGIKRDYKRLMWEAEYYVQTEIADKTLSAEFIKYCQKNFDKKSAALLKNLSWVKFVVCGKHAYIANRGAELPDNIEASLKKHYELFLEQAKKVKVETAEEEKTTTQVTISIQDRMREQLEMLFGTFEGVVDEWMAGKDVTKFNAYNAMASYKETKVKPAHAKIVRDVYAYEQERAQEIVDWADDEIKEAYSYTNTKQRKALLTLYTNIVTACDTIINEGKAARKPRKPKAVSKTKLVEKVKYKDKEPALGLASINPIEILDAKRLWLFNTKNRKLIQVIADELTGPLAVKGTTIVGMDSEKSVMKTVRKPEILKGCDKLARTKLDKLYGEINAVEAKFNGRLNEHCIIIKAFDK